MRKRYVFRPIVWALALLGTILGGVMLSAAEAAPTPPTAVVAPAAAADHGGLPTLPYYVGAPDVCINDHTQGSGIPFYTAGTRWDQNQAVFVRHESQVGGDCTAAGYPLGRQLEVFLVNSSEPGCVHYYSTVGPPNEDGASFRTRTIAYLHANNLSCWSTATRKANRASQFIGGFLGNKLFENTTVSVMGWNTYDTVPYPIDRDRFTVEDHYWWWRKV